MPKTLPALVFAGGGGIRNVMHIPSMPNTLPVPAKKTQCHVPAKTLQKTSVLSIIRSLWPWCILAQYVGMLYSEAKNAAKNQCFLHKTFSVLCNLGQILPNPTLETPAFFLRETCKDR